MKAISYCLPYYANPGMLAKQYETWASYPDVLKCRMEIVIVDDGTPDMPAADVPRPKGLPPLSIYRIDDDIPWNQHAARNIAAHHAKHDWLLMTDMDHEVPAGSLERILRELDNPKDIYKFRRLDAPDMKPKIKDGKEHPHPNTFVVHQSAYWTVGGYDERLCGVYGTDSLFRKFAEIHGYRWRQTEINVVRYAREVIPDASTTQYDRDAYRNSVKKKQIANELKDGLEDGVKPHVMTQEYRRVL